MAIGTVTIGETPCCGLIERTYEAVPDELSTTRMTHYPGELGQFSRAEHDHTISSGPYAPTFTREQDLLARGICPDCKQRFRS